jgi:basic amino acid/polyamine antiporter, APA family
VSRLGVWNATTLLIGIIIGAGIFESSALIARGAGSWEGLALLWIVGALLSFAGASCYAELATTYPEYGGEAEYLRLAFGPRMGFLFAWARCMIIQPGSIASMAYVASHAFLAACGVDDPSWILPLSVLIAVALTANAAFGSFEGRIVYRTLAVVKVLSFLALPLIALLFGTPHVTPEAHGPSGEMALSLILILYCFGGWSEIAYLAPDISRPARSIPLALFGSIAAVAALYLGVQYAMMSVLTLSGLQQSSAPVPDTLARLAIPGSVTVGALMVGISSLGATSGMILTGGRLNHALGRQQPLLGFLASRESTSFTTALFFQCLLTVIVIAMSGTFAGAVVYTTSVTWCFFTLTGCSLLVLRVREPDRARPVKAPLYPLTPLAFILSSAFVAYSAFRYDPAGSAIALCVTAAGLPLCRRPPPLGHQG